MAGSAWTNQVQNQVVVSGTNGGVFIYSGTPAHGNPPVYWITNGGLKDPFGNVLIAIQGSIALIAGTWQAFSTANGFLQWWYSTVGSSGPWTNGASITQGNTINGDLALDSNPGTVSQVSEVYLGNDLIKLWAPAAIGNLSGVQFTAGTGLGALNNGTLETWNSLGTLAGYTVDLGRYRATALGETELDITVVSGGANAASVSFSNTLPAAYQPTGFNRVYPLAGPVAGAHLVVATTGIVSVVQTVNTAGAVSGQAFVPVN